MLIITLEEVREAIVTSVKGHKKQYAVRKLLKNQEKETTKIYHRLLDGSWESRIKYRKIIKVNNNGKTRYIDSPNLETRIYQHIALQKILPIYQKEDPGSALNCKKGCGITAKGRNKSVVKRLKNLYYDKTDYRYVLVIDQRKCYDHIRVSKVRRSLKNLLGYKGDSDIKDLIDFVIKVSITPDNKFPIGTPTSPVLHHILMLEFDKWVKQELTEFHVRYADDNILAFYNSRDANSAKWRIQWYWWYNLGMRSKSRSIRVLPLECSVDFCGYIFHRKTISGSHQKGYTRIRGYTLKKAVKSKRPESKASYFGLLAESDSYKELLNMEINEILSRIKNKPRNSEDLEPLSSKELIQPGNVFTIHKVSLLKGKQEPGRKYNLIDMIVSFEKRKGVVYQDGATKQYKISASLPQIIDYFLLLQGFAGDSIESVFPITGVEFVNNSGYMIKGSQEYISNCECSNKFTIE